MDRLVSVLKPIITGNDLIKCDDLITTGIIDSLQIVEIIAAIEDEYNIQIEGDDIDPDNFVNVITMKKMVDKYINNGSLLIPDIFITVLSKINFWIYGNGKNAEKAYKELEKYGCVKSILGVLVGADYWYEGAIFHGIPVSKYDEHEEYENLLITFDPSVYAKDLYKFIKNDNVHNLYIFSSWRMFLNNHWIGFGSNKCHFIDNYYEIAMQRGLDEAYYIDNKNKFIQTHEWLEDALSKKTMDLYINGHIKQKNYPMLEVWKQEDAYNQYFPTFMDYTSDEIVVDCGAFTGDTFESYIYHVGRFGKYYAFEPDTNSVKKLLLATMFYENSTVIEKGVSSICGEVGMNIEGGGCSSIALDSKNIIKITAIDDEISEDVTFIKMDIEGQELEALKGARETIKRCKPKLAICVYHKKEDLIDIPHYIKSLRADYKLYLRAHEPTLSELVLYAL